MADLFNTVLTESRAKYMGQLDQDEHRKKEYGVYAAAKDATDDPTGIISSDLKQKAKENWGRSTKVPVIKRGTPTLKTKRTCNISGQESESDLVSLDYATIAYDIEMVPAQYEQNEIAYQQDFLRKITDVENAMANELDSRLVTIIEAAKSQVNNSGLVGAGKKYTLSGDAIQVPDADKTFYFSDLKSIMYSNDFTSGMYNNIMSPEVMSYINILIAQGAGNAANSQFQFNGYTNYVSRNVTNGVGDQGTMFTYEGGKLGVLTQNSFDARKGTSLSETNKWSTSYSDLLGFEYDVYQKFECDDVSGKIQGGASSVAHLSQVEVQKWQVSFDVAFMTPYNSDPATYAGSICKTAFKDPA